MSIIEPDFLGYEAILSNLYNSSLDVVPRTSYIDSDAVSVGTLGRREALVKDFQTNLGLCAKYILNVNLLPFQLVLLERLWNRRFVLLTMTRGGGKTFILRVYSILRALLNQGSKIILVGANFRQSKLIFEEIERIYRHAPLLQHCCPKPPVNQPARSILRVGESTITAIPLGHDGHTIRGLRATHILADEFASIPEEVFQVVVRGFAAVTKDPHKQVMDIFKEKHLAKKGLDIDLLSGRHHNQIVLSGTAYYKFNHFYQTMQKYDELITNEVFLQQENDDGIMERIDFKDYVVIQIPYTAMPVGFMDISQIGQARLTMHPILFAMEYLAEFAGTTGGFFPMLDIENATAGNSIKNEDGTLALVGGEPVINPYFSIELEADPNAVYVMGADPARETDNFAVCIIKITGEGNYKIVYADAWNRKEWGYSVRRIRELIKKFNVQRIAIDKGGGGTTVEDLLKDQKYIEPGEQPIFNIEKEEEEAQWFMGQNILEVKDFSDYTWYRESNYSLQGDIHHKRLMFPGSYVDESIYNKYHFRESEIDDCFKEIQAMRLELAQIERTMKGSNREHFDLPDEQIKQAKEKGVMERKDRYSALLLASYAARQMQGYGEWKDKHDYIGGQWLENM
jgi:hypothetical protein